MKPQDLQWIEGDLPDVLSVPKDTWYLAWIVDIQSRKVVNVEAVHPWGNELNPIRWCSSSMPIDGWMYTYEGKEMVKKYEVAYWAEIK